MIGWQEEIAKRDEVIRECKELLCKANDALSRIAYRYWYGSLEDHCRYVKDVQSEIERFLEERP